MITLTDIVLLALSTLAISYWLESMRAKEIARAAGKRLCQSHELMILDDTVSIQKVWPSRCSGGRLCLRREYAFEFTSDGEYRYTGEVILMGKQVFSSSLGVYREP